MEFSLRELVRELVLGYAFWSLFHGLAPMIWFYPLNELEISGYEAFCLIWLCPILMGVDAVFRFVQNRWTLNILRLAVLASLASFQAPDTLSRLAVLSLGNGAAMLVLTASLWSKSSRERCLSYWGLILGFFSLLVGRIYYTSFCPTWWTDQTNTVVISVVAVATFDKIVAGGDDSTEEKNSDTPRPHNWLFTSVGFGSLLFLTHWIYGEVSILTRWTVVGFPNTGPLPYPCGLCVLCVLLVGSVLSFYPSLRQSIIPWVLAAASFGVLLLRPSQNPWMAFAGGLVGGVYIMMVWAEMVDRVISCPPARTMFVSVLVYIVEILFSVWTTAFNFVPGGEYTREHTDYLMLFILTTIAFALYSSNSSAIKSTVVSADFIGAGAKIKCLLLVVLLAGGGGFMTRYEANNLQMPVKEKPGVLRAAIWTFHFGYDNKGWPSMERGAQMLEDTQADVITLLESDASKPFLGNNDLGMWLGERLGMHVDFGPSTQDHTWGNLLLSKYPIIKSVHHLLPSPYGELAPAITATVNVSGQPVDFVVTHMGNDRDVYDRELQAKFLAKELRNCANPAIFLGYVTSAPGSRDYKRFIQEGGMKDIDETDKDRWCEYIMYKNLIKLGYARISHAGLSDTELQMATFEIPDDVSNYKDNTRVVTEGSKLHHQIRFSKKFGEYSVGHNWVPVHRFHMSTPKYFLP